MAFERIFCPRCHKRLFDANVHTRGEIYVYCKCCKKSVLIELPKKNNVMATSANRESE